MTTKPQGPSISYDQAQYLNNAFQEEQSEWAFHITNWDAEGWIFVEKGSALGEDGSGVWIDKQGIEHYDR